MWAAENDLSLNQAQKILTDSVKNNFQGDYLKDSKQYTIMQKDLALEILKDHPAELFKMQFLSMLKVWFIPLRGAIENQMGFSSGYNPITLYGDDGVKGKFSQFFGGNSILTIILSFWQIIVMVFISFGLIKSLFSKGEYLKNRYFWISLFLVIYFLILSGGPEANARFRVVFIPFVLICCCAIPKSLKKKVAEA